MRAWRISHPYFMLLAVVLLVLNLSVSTAFASATTNPTSVMIKQTATLTLDCVHMDAKAREYANKHHLCDKTNNTGPSPYNTVVGDCGSSTLTIIPNGTVAPGFYQSAHSTLGAIVYVNRNLQWINYSTNQGNYWTDGYVASGDWINTQYINTAHGFVAGTLSGNIFLIWGGTCTIDYPSDGKWL